MSNFNENIEYVIQRHGLPQDEAAALLLTFLAQRYAHLHQVVSYMAYYLQRITPAFRVPYNGTMPQEERSRRYAELKQLRFTLDMEMERLAPRKLPK